MTDLQENQSGCPQITITLIRQKQDYNLCMHTDEN